MRTRGANPWHLVAIVVALSPPVRAADPLPLRLRDDLLPAGGRSTLTDNWGVIRFTLVNPDPAPRDARVLLFFAGRPDVQYGRDVWVPGNSQVTSWVPVGPPGPGEREFGREIKYILADRAGGETRLLSATGAESIRNRMVPYRAREPSYAVLADDIVSDPADPTAADDPDGAGSRAVQLARVFRAGRGVPSEGVYAIPDRFLPPTAEAFDGLDLLVLAGDRLAADPAGARAVRQWVQAGGVLWVLLDRVDPATLGVVLGDDLGFEVAGRTSLTTVELKRAGEGSRQLIPERDFDKPVPFVQVLPGAANTVLYEVNGWPAAFTRPLGRGKVAFTTLGDRGWHRPRKMTGTPRDPADPASPYRSYKTLPVPLDPLITFAGELLPEPVPAAFGPDDLQPLVSAEIGYRVVDRRTAAVVMGGGVLAAVGLAVGLRRSRRPELTGWVAPAAMLTAAGLLVGLGTASREAIPPTAVAASVVAVAPGTGEGAAEGLFAVYRPASGEARLSALGGGRLDIDTAGVEGQVRRRVTTDAGAWHWENALLPAGVRAGPFRATVPTGDLGATARFGPAGVEGRLTPGPYKNPADAVVIGAGREPAAARLGPDGTLTVTPADLLPAGQYLASGVLTDNQQRRQEVYRKLLARPLPRHLDGRDLLLVWAEADDLPFEGEEGNRTVGQSLFVVPLAFERTPAGTPVTVPGGFIPWSAEGLARLPVERSEPAEFRVRFRLPPAVLPLTLDRATLTLRLTAPARRVTVSAGGVTVREIDAPGPEPIRVEIADPAALAVDPAGGLTLRLAVGRRPGPAGKPADVRAVEVDDQWRLDGMSLEVVGRTGK